MFRFTMMELMIVISIILILVSLLLPALKKARDKANDISCASTQRNLGQYIQMYVNDNKYIPHAAYADSSYGCIYYWQTILLVYIDPKIVLKNTTRPQVWVNEAMKDKNGLVRQIIRCPAQLEKNNINCHYGLSKYLSPTNSCIALGNNPGAVRYPSRRVLMGDSKTITLQIKPDDKVDYRHSGGFAAVFTFIDGHVEIMAKSKVLTYKETDYFWGYKATY